MPGIRLGATALRLGASALALTGAALPATPDFEEGATAVPLELSLTDTRTKQLAAFQADASAMMAFGMMSYDITAVTDGWWDDAATWGGTVPTVDDMVKIPAGINVWVRSDFTAFFVWLDGFLGVKNGANVTASVSTLMGSRTSRFWCGEDLISFTGNFHWEFPKVTIDSAFDPRFQSNGFMSMGRTRVHGKVKDAFKFTDGAAVEAGATSVTLAAAPVGWEVGDTIVIPATHLVRPAVFGNPAADPGNQTETRVITAIDGATVSWTAPLVYDHTVNPNNPDPEIRIGNQTRNITFASPSDALVHERGHVMLMFSDDHQWAYAEFAYLGRTDKRTESWDFPDHPNHPNQEGAGVLATDSIKGRYSFHLHGCGPDSANIPLTGIVCHDSYSLGIAVHNSNADIDYCLGVNMWGSAIFTESGNENGFLSNSGGMGHRSPRQDVSNKNTADAARHDWGHSQVIWLQGRLMAVRDCFAYGCSNGTGFVSNVRGAKEDFVRVKTLERRTLQPIFNNGHYFFNSEGEIANFALNTVVPIDVDGVDVHACLIGTTVLKAGSQQDHFAYSHFHNVRVSNVIRGIFFEYTGRYLCQGLRAYYDEDGTPDFTASFEIGVQVGLETFQFTLDGVHTVGFKYGVDFDHETVPVEEAPAREVVPDENWHMIILNGVTGSARTELIKEPFATGANAARDRYLDDEDLVIDASYPLYVGDDIEIPNTQTAFNAGQVYDPEKPVPCVDYFISGTITDSAGTYSVPAGRDRCALGNGILWGTLRTKEQIETFLHEGGFWTEEGTGRVFTELDMIVGDRCRNVTKYHKQRIYFEHGAIQGDPRPDPPVTSWINGSWVNNGTKA